MSSGESKPFGRPFKKGQSGNPNGRRPKGLTTVEKLRTALAKDLPAIVEIVVKKAKDGDLNAARLIMERVLPPLKPSEATVILETFAGSRTAQGEGILGAMAEGALAPGQAAQLLGALAAQAKIVEGDEMKRRLDALERKMGASDNDQ